MSDGGSSITLEGLRGFDFERVHSRQTDDPDDAGKQTCDNYSKSFVDESKLAVREGDQKKEVICDLFALLTSAEFYFNDAFPPSFRPPDIDEEHLELLTHFVPEIEDPELQARIADILWNQRFDKGFQFAELAVDAYLETSARFDRAEASRSRNERIERALQLAAVLGKTGQRYADVIEFIETELREMEEAGILRGPAHLLQLLHKHRRGDPRVYIPYATHLATEFENMNAWEGARTVWQITRDWHLLARDGDAARYAEQRAAMTYEPEALGWMQNGSHTHFKVIDLFQKGIVALRQSRAPKDDIDRVHALLLESQASYDDYKSISFSTDISELVESIKRSFRDRTLTDCIYGLAANFRPPSFESLKAQAEELQTKHQMPYFFTKQIIDKQGKMIGKRPGYTFDDSEGLTVNPTYDV